MEDFLKSWGYLGIFLGILATGIPFFPLPEEVPVVLGGIMAHAGQESVRWYMMLPVCIVAVVIGDAMLYGAGRWWGTRLLEFRWIKRHVLPPQRLQKIEDNFAKHGIKILLFARLTPGIRAPIFVTAGIVRVPLIRFVIADGIYAIPGVCLLFGLGYWFSESILDIVKDIEQRAKGIVVLVLLVLVTGYFLYRFLRKPIVTGDPEEIPPLVDKVTHTLEQVSSRILPGHHDHPGTVSQTSAARATDASTDHKPADSTPKEQHPH